MMKGDSRASGQADLASVRRSPSYYAHAAADEVEESANRAFDAGQQALAARTVSSGVVRPARISAVRATRVPSSARFAPGSACSVPVDS